MKKKSQADLKAGKAPRNFDWKPVILALISFLLYANTFRNDYAGDDFVVIVENRFTQKGVAGIPDILKYETFAGHLDTGSIAVGGGRYRPLSLVMFAVEHEIAGNNAFIGHFINAILYALLVFIFYKLALLLMLRFLPDAKEWPVFLAVLWFAVHPLHVEAVANIKGRDEILSALLAITAIFYVLKTEPFHWRNGLVTGLLFLLACLSKEGAAPLAILLFFIVFQQQSGNFTQKTAPALWALGAVLIYILLRQSVLAGLSVPQAYKNLMNEPFMEMSVAERYATVAYTFFKYFLLIIWPQPLTYDYYPYHIAIQHWASLQVIAGLSIALVSLFFILKNIKKPGLFWIGLAWTWLTFLPVSNLFFNIGAFMAERFMFLPSAGIAIMLIPLFHLIEKRYPVYRYVIMGFAIILSIFIFERNKAWKDDYTLAKTDVRTSYRSAKSNEDYAHELYKKANESGSWPLLDSSEKYFLRAIEIYPMFFDAHSYLGQIKIIKRKPLEALEHLKILAQIIPDEDYTQKITYLVSQMETSEAKLKVVEDFLRVAPQQVGAKKLAEDLRSEINREGEGR